MRLDQKESLQKQILRAKARIAQLERRLNAPPPPPVRYPGLLFASSGRSSGKWRPATEEQLQVYKSELVALEAALGSLVREPNGSSPKVKEAPSDRAYREWQQKEKLKRQEKGNSLPGSPLPPYPPPWYTEKPHERQKPEPVPTGREGQKSSLSLGEPKLGETIDCLIDQLKRLRDYGRGRRKTEAEFRSVFPEFQLWREIDSSKSLRPAEREAFFAKSLDGYDQWRFFEFIGWIIGHTASTTQKKRKEYRKETGKQRKRRTSA